MPDPGKLYVYDGTDWQPVPVNGDHGSLNGLGDVDDHPDYLLLDGTRQMTGPLDMNAQILSDAGPIQFASVAYEISLSSGVLSINGPAGSSAHAARSGSRAKPSVSANQAAAASRSATVTCT